MIEIGNVTQHVLTPRRFAMQQLMAGALARDRMAAEVIEDRMWDNLLFRLTTTILTDSNYHGTKDIELEVPATWWQHLKRDHLPQWFTRRWPVRHTTMTTTVSFEHMITYPSADFIPANLGAPVIYQKFSDPYWRASTQPATGDEDS